MSIWKPTMALQRAAPPDLQNRLRAAPLVRPFHVVLVEPEIPPNTGNIARLCAATCAALHLVEPLGFSIDEHAVRRAGLDYWPLVDLHTHPDFPRAEQAIRHLTQPRSPRFWFFSARARTSYIDCDFRLGDALVFGRESRGLPEPLLEERAAEVVGIPTLGGVRSLNLANAAAIALYEALRRNGALEVTADRG
jgi:tRNA (cytidine/uridine-2'-O-)-methyltransferase